MTAARPSIYRSRCSLYAGVDASNGQQLNQSVGRCGKNYVGAVMITNGAAAFAGPPISNTKIAHSKSHGIVSFANDADTVYMTTSYAKPDVTFDDLTGKALDFTGQCNP